MMNNNNSTYDQLGFAGKIARLFVMNSRLSILLILTIFVWGILSFFLTPKQYNPEIVAPAFQISTEFPGANSKEVEELITKPLENKVMDLDGVDEVMSQSIEGGLSVVTVKFFVGESLEDSKIKLAQKISGNLDLKPFGANDPLIKELNPDDVPIITIALSSDALSPITLRKLALDLKEEINLIPNTSNVDVVGGKMREAKIILNSEELISNRVPILGILNAIKKNNIKVLNGALDAKDKKILVEIDGTIKTEDDLKKIVVVNDSKQLVYLEDIANIELGEEDNESFVRFRNADSLSSQETVFISVAKKKGTNISNVTDSVIARVDELKQSLIPDFVKINVVRDDGFTAKREISGLVTNLLQSIIIVSIILLLFLGPRPSFIVAIAIPLTLASVFGIGLLAGQTINRITLFALILSLGLLVDNATVIVENAVRHVEKGKNTKLSVIKAVDEVGVGLLMSTVTTLFAFYPMAFVTGMMGPYMGPIPFFVPAALIVSLFIAFSINPFLASKLIKPKNKKIQHPLVEKFVNKQSELMAKYKALLHKLFVDNKLRKKLLVATLLVLMLTMSFPVFGLVKFRMLPKADKNQFYIYLNLPEGTPSSKTNKVTEEVENFLLKQENVLSLQSFVGHAPILDFNGLFKGSNGRNTENLSTIKVNLVDRELRSIKSERIVINLRPKLVELLQNNPDVKIQLIEDPPGPPVISTVLAKIKGNNLNEMKKISYDIENLFKDTDELVDIDSTKTDNLNKLTLSIDKDKAANAFVSAEEAAYVLHIALSGQRISMFHDDENKEQEYVFIRLDKKFRDQIEDLKSIFISNSKGEKIPLLEIVNVSNTISDDVIYHDDREKTIYVYGEMGNRSVTYAIIDMFGKALSYDLPSGNGKVESWSLFGVNYVDKNNGETYKVEWGGEWEMTLEVFRDLGLAMMVAIFLVYVVLVAQFHSFKTPLIVMGTIPLAMIGVIPGFAIIGLLLGVYFNATSMIGVIALSGIVVNNAIILLEYLNGLREKGFGIEEALVEAGSTRLRPIVLTSLTTILGSFTIIGDPVWSGLAWSIIFGISISTALTLIIFPVLYYTFSNKDWDCKQNKLCESHGPTLN